MLKQKGESASSQAGDISAVDPMGMEFVKRHIVECKFYKDLGLQKLFTEANCPLEDFWLKLLDECDENDKEPFLVVKQNRMPVFLITNYEVMRIMLKPNIRHHEKKLKVVVRNEVEDMYFYLFNDVLKNVNPEEAGLLCS